MYSELEIAYTDKEGREFEAKRGKIDADIGYESHGMFVMKFKFDWGIYTFGSYLMDLCLDWDAEPKDRVFVGQPYNTDLIKAMLKVCNVDYFSSIQNHEVYILFGSERNSPVGLVNIHDVQNSLIFDDIVKAD
jgi:hypothetical protein